MIVSCHSHALNHFLMSLATFTAQFLFFFPLTTHIMSAKIIENKEEKSCIYYYELTNL